MIERSTKDPIRTLAEDKASALDMRMHSQLFARERLLIPADASREVASTSNCVGIREKIYPFSVIVITEDSWEGLWRLNVKQCRVAYMVASY